MSTVTGSVRAEHWRDASASPSARAADLVARMTLEEKAAQLVGVWVGADASGTGVAPLQKDLAEPIDWTTVTQHGLGQLTRPFGTAPVEPVAAARSLAASQQHIAGPSADIHTALNLRLTGPVREVGADRVLLAVNDVETLRRPGSGGVS